MMVEFKNRECQDNGNLNFKPGAQIKIEVLLVMMAVLTENMVDFQLTGKRDRGQRPNGQ